MFVIIIDRFFTGVCVGLGLYFVDVETREEAEELGEKRCEMEREFREEAYWKVVEIHEVDENETLGSWVKRHKSDWYVLTIK